MTYAINLKESFGPLDEKILKTIEMYLGFKFPKTYKEFLVVLNGGFPTKRFFLLERDGGYVIDLFFGFVPDEDINILLHYRDYKNRIPENMFPIGNDPFGNLILLSVKNADRGKIYFWDHEMEADNGETPDYSNLTLIANSFEEFIASLRDEEDL